MFASLFHYGAVVILWITQLVAAREAVRRSSRDHTDHIPNTRPKVFLKQKFLQHSRVFAEPPHANQKSFAQRIRSQNTAPAKPQHRRRGPSVALQRLRTKIKSRNSPGARKDSGPYPPYKGSWGVKTLIRCPKHRHL